MLRFCTFLSSEVGATKNVTFGGLGVFGAYLYSAVNAIDDTAERVQMGVTGIFNLEI